MTAIAVAVGCFVRERMPRLRASQFAQEFKTLALFLVAMQAPSISAQRWHPDYCCSCLKRILVCVWWFSLFTGWCWQEVGSRPQAGLQPRPSSEDFGGEIVGEHLQPNVSLFLCKRLGLKNDVAQARQFTVREYVVDLH